jgi:hypothetical protein
VFHGALVGGALVSSAPTEQNTNWLVHLLLGWCTYYLVGAVLTWLVQFLLGWCT